MTTILSPRKYQRTVEIQNAIQALDKAMHDGRLDRQTTEVACFELFAELARLAKQAEYMRRRRAKVTA